jgi:hypothetical protein
MAGMYLQAAPERRRRRKMTPTEPVPSILDREALQKAIGEDLRALSLLLQEVTNKATWLLDGCRPDNADQYHEQFALLFIFRHMIKLTDGIETLVRSGCPGPAVIYLRTLFEMALYMDYLLEDGPSYRERSLCYFLHYANDKIAEGNRYDEHHPRGMEFRRNWSAGKYTKLTPFPGVPNSSEVRARFQEVANRSIFDPVRPILGRFQHERLKWYGARNVRQLAQSLERLAEYDFIYGMWSREVHSGDIRPVHHPLRTVDQLGDLKIFGPHYLGMSILLVAKKCRPDLFEDMKAWYQSQVRLPPRDEAATPEPGA